LENESSVGERGDYTCEGGRCKTCGYFTAVFVFADGRENFEKCEIWCAEHFVGEGRSADRRSVGRDGKKNGGKLRNYRSLGTPILCVGEPKSVRKKGFAAAKTYVKKQLLKNLSFTKNHKLKTINLIIAYEPIWAISTSGGGKETPEDAAKMIGFIRQQLKTSTQGGSTSGGKNHKLKTIYLLYGGSVNAKNVGDFLAMKDIDGALVGGASLHPSEFKKMVKIAESIK